MIQIERLQEWPAEFLSELTDAARQEFEAAGPVALPRNARAGFIDGRLVLCFGTLQECLLGRTHIWILPFKSLKTTDARLVKWVFEGMLAETPMGFDTYVNVADTTALRFAKFLGFQRSLSTWTHGTNVFAYHFAEPGKAN